MREQAREALGNLLQTILPIGPNQAAGAAGEILTLSGPSWRLAVVSTEAEVLKTVNRIISATTEKVAREHGEYPVPNSDEMGKEKFERWLDFYWDEKRAIFQAGIQQAMLDAG